MTGGSSDCSCSGSWFVGCSLVDAARLSIAIAALRGVDGCDDRLELADSDRDMSLISRAAFA